MADLQRAIDELETVLTAARELVGPGPLEPWERELTAIRQRLRYLGDTVVVALAGGTGSGKSSLLNALAGDAVVDTGVLRPTTERPLAWVPRDAEPALDRLLDELGIDRREPHDQGSGLAVVDLPDLDSVEVTHRATVDALLPRIDLVVWVLDPQKYNDRAVHELIAARAGYGRQLLFVLNQVDRLAPEDLEAVRDDLVSSLRHDGIHDPAVRLVAADPTDGPPLGVDELRRELAERVADKQIVLDKLTRDAAAVADGIAATVGIHPDQTGADLSRRWEQARDAAADAAASVLVDDLTVARARQRGARVAVSAGSGPLGRIWHVLRRSAPLRGLGAPQDQPTRSAAIDRGPVGRLDAAVGELSRRLTELSTGVGGAAGRALRATFTPGTVEQDLGVAVEVARSAHPPPEIAPRPRWRAAALLQTIWTIAAVVGAVWWWTEPTAVRPGTFPWPAVLLVGGAVLALLGVRLLRAAGSRRGARLAEAHREELRAALREQLERRTGARLAKVLDARERTADGLRRVAEMTRR